MSTLAVHPTNFIDEYIAWLRSRMTAKETNGYVELVTPFLDRDNDQLVIYAKISGSEIHLTDDGETITGLANSGCDIRTGTRRDRLREVILTHGLQLQGDEIVAHTTRAEFPMKKHMMVQGMLAIGDMYLTQRAHVSSFFFDDVAAYFKQKGIFAIQRPMFYGKSGMSQMFDFVVPEKSGEGRYIKLLGNLSKPNVNNAIFAFQDVSALKGPIGMDVIFNDTEKKVSEQAPDAFSAYGISLYQFSKMERFVAAIQ